MPIIKSGVETIDNQQVTILVEVDKEPGKPSPYGDTRSIRPEEIVEAARDVFDDGIALARACAQKTVNGIRMMDNTFRPEEFELKLSIKLDSEMGAIIAKASAGAQMEVTMKWKPRE